MVKSTQTDYPEPARLGTRAQMCADVCGRVWVCRRGGGGGEADEFMEKEKVGGGEGNRSGRETSPWRPASPDGPTSVCREEEEPPQSPA